MDVEVSAESDKDQGSEIKYQITAYFYVRAPYKMLSVCLKSYFFKLDDKVLISKPGPFTLRIKPETYRC